MNSQWESVIRTLISNTVLFAIVIFVLAFVRDVTDVKAHGRASTQQHAALEEPFGEEEEEERRQLLLVLLTAFENEAREQDPNALLETLMVGEALSARSSEHYRAGLIHYFEAGAELYSAAH